MIELATTIAFALLALGMLFTLIRLILGPTLADRILALDVLTTLGIGIIATFAVRVGQAAYIDVAIALSLMGFVATISFAKYLISGGKQ
jgi:multicomponent Na+:H+ antiporter subunit F